MASTTPHGESGTGTNACTKVDIASADTGSSEVRYQKISRDNTVEEKRAMKKARRKRKRQVKMKELKCELKAEKKVREKAERMCLKYRSMSRTYWERWRWELQQRREAMINERMAARGCGTQSVKFVLPYIDPCMLEDPVIEGKSKECYVGRGSFGIVRLQIYRSIQVAVKEFLPRSLAEDVTNEATLLASLCHPYLPCLFGICINEKPFRLVMQFNGLNATTISQELYHNRQKFVEETWILFCAQIVEALHYLHVDVGILHNDISTSNILITSNDGYHIILIDFGKATKITNAKLYHLSLTEQQEYTVRYPHLAPEVIGGKRRQSVYSDMYSIGLVFYRITGHCRISGTKREDLKEFAERCRSIDFFMRPKSSEALRFFETLLV